MPCDLISFYDIGGLPNNVTQTEAKALMMASRNGDTNAARCLLERKTVDVNQKNGQVKKLTDWTFLVFVSNIRLLKFGTSALGLAAISGHTETVGLLLDYGADMEAIHQVSCGRNSCSPIISLSHESRVRGYDCQRTEL